MKKLLVTNITIISLFMIFSCQLPTKDMVDVETTSTVEIIPGETGKLAISFPLVSSSLTNFMVESSPVSRSYLFVKYAEVTLVDKLDQEVDSATITLNEASLDTFGEIITTELSVPWGTDYRIYVDIYDQDDSLGNIIVSGISDPFDMAFDQVDVAVTLTPSDPTELVADVATSGTMDSSVYSDGSFTTVGSETWYTLTTEAAGTMALSVNTAGEAILFLANSQGSFQTTVRKHNEDQPTLLVQSVEEGETWYVGMILLDQQSQSVDYEISYQNLDQGLVRFELDGLLEEAGNELHIALNETTVMTSSVIDGDNLTLWALDSSDSSLWQGLGEQDYTLFIDKNGNGIADRDDSVLEGTISLEAGVNELSYSLGDFSLYAPDITGVWFDLSDNTLSDTYDDDMEVITLVRPDNTFTIYQRRHYALSADTWDYLDEDEFIVFMSGTYSQNGYELTFTVELWDILTSHLMADALTENDIAIYAIYVPALALPDGLGLKTYSQIYTLLSAFIDTTTLAEIFEPKIVELIDVGDGELLFSASDYEYSFTHVEVDDFRAPSDVTDFPDEIQPYL